jgi:hypothetical protein
MPGRAGSRITIGFASTTTWASSCCAQKVSPTAAREVICYHAWEGYQFPNGAVQNDGARLDQANNMVGDYGHLSTAVTTSR